MICLIFEEKQCSVVPDYRRYHTSDQSLKIYATLNKYTMTHSNDQNQAKVQSNKQGDQSRQLDGSSRRRSRRRNKPPAAIASIAGSGGRYSPLNQESLEQIHLTALDLLETVGLSEAPASIVALVLEHGGTLLPNSRLSLPEALVSKAIAQLQRNIQLHGQVPGHTLNLSNKQVHVGTGGAAPLVVDLVTGQYRDSTLVDLYNAARLVDTLDNVQFFSRSLVARDMPDSLTLDINTAYASLAGSRKHVMVSATTPESVTAIANLCFAIAGSKERFVQQPFLSLNINHVVSPMRFSPTASEVLIAAARAGIPVQVNTFGQLGASSPVTIAGCVAQTVAETLAGMVIAWLANPNVAAIFGPRPMITDLRTGGMAGGAGEQALLTAAAVQMAQYYGFSNSTIAGATDSKVADAQSGFEKNLSVTLAAQTGCNLITQACGMQAGLMACSFESYVIDNDMLGAILRSLSPIEVSSSTLNATMIADVINGDGHFLGHKDTLERMQTDFLYPSVSDRRDHEVWAADGSPDIRDVANKAAQRTLAEHFPVYLPVELDTELRQQFDIRLSVDQMLPERLAK